MEDDRLKNMSDEQLITYTMTKDLPQEIRQAAAAELHKRQKEYGDKMLSLQNYNISLQKWILRAAIVAIFIATITLVVVLLK